MNATKVHARFHLFLHSLSSPTVTEIDHASELFLHTHIYMHTWGTHIHRNKTWSTSVAPFCDCKLALTGLQLRVPWLPIMFYSASIQRVSEVLLHELSRSASSLFIINTLSFWVVKYWFRLSLCRSHSHNMTQYLFCRDVCGHFERSWLNFKKGLPLPQLYCLLTSF